MAFEGFCLPVTHPPFQRNSIYFCANLPQIDVKYHSSFHQTLLCFVSFALQWKWKTPKSRDTHAV